MIKIKSIKKQFLNVIFLLLLVFVTFFVLINSSKEFSINELFSFISQLNPIYLLLGVLAMIGYVLTLAMSYKVICSHLGYKCSLIKHTAYACSEVYYSAITPSASGGQPAAALYMHKGGIPVSVSSATLLFNTFNHTLAIMVFGIGALIVRAGGFIYFGTFSKILIIAGLAVQFLLIAFFTILMISRKTVEKILIGAVSLLAKIRIIRKKEERTKQILSIIEQYVTCIDMIKSNKLLFVKVLSLNLLQRLCNLIITWFVFAATGITGFGFIDIIAMQSFCMLGANSVPLPGSVGVSEMLYVDVFKSAMPDDMLLPAMMVTRCLSYYLCFILSGIVTFINHIISFKKKL